MIMITCFILRGENRYAHRPFIKTCFAINRKLGRCRGCYMTVRRIKLFNRGHETFELPKAPNFIRRTSDGLPVPYGDLSDAQIKKVGQAWTSALLDRAKEQRTNRTEYWNPPRKGKGEQ